MKSSNDTASMWFSRSAALFLHAFIVVAGLGLTWRIHSALDTAERERVRTEFAGLAEGHLARVEREVGLFLDVLASMGPLYELSDRISVEDFEEFAAKGLVFPKKIMGGFGFAQWIPDDVRTQLEEATDPAMAFTLLEFDTESWSFKPARRRPIYFPVMYQDPPESLGLPLGADLGAHPLFTAAIERAMASGEPTLGEMKMQGEQADGLYVLIPRIQLSETSASASIAVGILRPREILNRAIGGRALEEMAFELIRVEGEEAEAIGHAEYEPDGGLVFRGRFDVADARLQFEGRAEPSWAAARIGTQSRWILGAGLIMTALATAMVGLLLRRAHHVEALVAVRTKELKQSHQQLEEAMRLRMRLEQEMLDISSREQQRVGRDLHDSVGQKLSGAVYMSRALMRLMEQPDREGDVVETAQRVHETLKESVTQVRRMAHGLSPIALSSEGLSDALRRLGKESAEAFGIDCPTDRMETVVTKDAQAAVHLFQIAQEALNNAVRHGGAKQVRLSLERVGEHGVMVIADNGRGMAPGASQAGGMGLRIMRYRAEMLGGDFALTSEVGQGTEVVVRFPVGDGAAVS